MATLLFDLLTASASKVPDKVLAKDEKSNEITYSGLVKKVNALLPKILTVVQGNSAPVAIILPKSIRMLEAIFTVSAAGRPILIVSRNLMPSQIQHIVKDAECQLLISNREVLAQCSVELTDIGVKHCMVLDEIDESVSFLRISHRSEEKTVGIDFPKSDSIGEKVPLRIPEDDAMIIYTSGSTGQQKGIVISHRNIVDGARIVSDYLGLRGSDIIAGILPFNFDAGFNQLLVSCYLGATIILIENQMPNHVFSLIEKESISVITGVPPVWAGFFNPRLSTEGINHDLSSVRVLANTGGKVPSQHLKKMREVFVNSKVWLMYGLTEAFRSTFLPPHMIEEKKGSVGIAVPEVEVSVVSSNGIECVPGEVGEIVHRGAFVAKGYLNSPGKTEMVFRPNPLRGLNQYLDKVVFSGDLGYKDKDGYLYLVGRKDAQIKIGSQRLNVSEVEDLISESPAIAEAVVVPFLVDDEQRLAAFLVPKEADVSDLALKVSLRKLLPSYMVPSEVIIVPRLPLGHTGKIDREALKRRLPADKNVSNAR